MIERVEGEREVARKEVGGVKVSRLGGWRSLATLIGGMS